MVISFKAGAIYVSALSLNKRGYIFKHEGFDTNEVSNITGNKHDNVPPFICMKTADKNVVFGWLASQTDMLAEDWKIIR